MNEFVERGRDRDEVGACRSRRGGGWKAGVVNEHFINTSEIYRHIISRYRVMV